MRIQLYKGPLEYYGHQGGLQIATNTAIDFRLGIMFAAPIPTTLNGKAINPALGHCSQCTSGNQIILNSYMYPAFYWTNGWDVLCRNQCQHWRSHMDQELYIPNVSMATALAGHLDSGRLVTNDLYYRVSTPQLGNASINSDTGNLVWTNTIKAPYGDGTAKPL